ncbi:MAG: PolC-type DNA polymerase III [Lachnospiraceae bacterium]|nr:PolC-type DNA polymerase III [Lachnospiraceae bacterium]
MKKFFDVVKINFDEDIERYFEEVEVESIKTTKEKKTLNFYLVAKDYIPYDILNAAKREAAVKLFNIDKEEVANEEFKNPIIFNVRYIYSDNVTCKDIYDLIKKDLYKEIKEKMLVAKALIKDEYMSFVDDSTLRISFDHIDTFKKNQDAIVDFIKLVYKERFDRNLAVEIQWLERNYSDERSETIKYEKDTYKENSSDVKELRRPKNVAINDRVHQSGKKRKSQISLDGDVLYGKKTRIKRDFRDLSKLVYAMDNVETNGVIYNLRTIEPEKRDFAIFFIYITDNEGCMEIKFFGNKEDVPLFKKRFKVGFDVKVEGKVLVDQRDGNLYINPYYIEKIGARTVIEHGKVGEPDYYNEIVTDRTDDEKIKRVELHLHTKSSTQDGVGEVQQYIATARKFGMTAMAITDHGSVNALADAYEYVSKNVPDGDFKIINGVEGYLVEDAETYYYNKERESIDDDYSFDDSFVIYDFITTGFNRKNDAIIKVIARKIEGKRIVEEFNEFVHFDKPLTLDVKDRTKILPSNLKNAKDLKEVLEMFRDFIGNSTVVTLNKNSVWKIDEIFEELGIDADLHYIDLIVLSRLAIKDLKTASINQIAKSLSVKIDSIANKRKEDKKYILTYEENLDLASMSFIALLDKITIDYGIDNLKFLKDKLVIDDNFIKRQKYYHIVILAKNDVGRVNLYKLVSDSHIKYMHNRRPRIPRSLLSKYREGLILGSACILGEFMDAVKDNVDDKKLQEIASFYDYLEIQPTLNNSFLLNEDSENFKSIKDLEALNIKVVKIGEELDKPVVATCDCHYVEKTDKIYREILRFGTMNKKVNRDKDGNIKEEVSAELESTNQELLYFRTTKEMLDEFSYLGVDKAYEVVVKNTNLISNMIEKVYPVRPDKCPPHIEGSDDELKNACHENLLKVYGENPPKEISDRLDNELKYIIDNGYSVMYIAAKKLIDYSKEFGYPVGSRGSVGSSLAATLSGVSEVDPLKPYYICPKCHHIEFDTEETRKYDNDTGFDMPDKVCPECNTLMHKNGVNIPFETFLGIPGDVKAQKEPDIDLNFCSVFQSKIHEKTVDLFGKENTFKAGTVGTVAAKTAYGYVMRFKEMTNLELNRSQVDYFRNKIVECKNTTGQHPGGMVVVPEGEKIYTFTPIQIAADKEGNDITTHFDYHKIDKNLLKLDILGHDAPLILKKLRETTGIDFNQVPFYEKEVLKLFESTESLGISPADISGTKLGCLTIPEFGTDFAMSMCIDAKPKTVADLIRISGLAHGTAVWQGNVQDLIKNGDCTLSTAICCRDDIMIYLIDKGIDSGIAFNIMERVRKGKKLTDEYRDIMRKHDVPEWYIGCCDKIQYMFPKAHAAAYVLAALRIAYYKIHYPREYYAVYFSIDKTGFDYKLMIKDKDEIHYHIEKIAKIINERKSKDRRFADAITQKESLMDVVTKAYRVLNGESEEEEKEIEVDEETLLSIQYEKMSANKLYDLYMCYRHVEEMKARGIDFCPIDIYKAKRSDFQVMEDGRIMPSFDSLTGIGTKEYDIDYNDEVPKSEKSTAMKCEIEGKKGEYTSIENFIDRTGVNKTRIAEMKELGLFNGMREKEETTIFDFI